VHGQGVSSVAMPRVFCFPSHTLSIAALSVALFLSVAPSLSSAQDAEAEVRTAAAYRLADIGKLCGKAKISEVVRTRMQDAHVVGWADASVGRAASRLHRWLRVRGGVTKHNSSCLRHVPSVPPIRLGGDRSPCLPAHSTTSLRVCS
jgi:hypothetical protein